MAVYNKRSGVTPEFPVYIGRGSMWGNPFVIGKDGNRDQVCEKHRRHLWKQIKSGEVSLTDLASLHGMDLVCYCAPLRCHGHTLEKAAEWAYLQLQVAEGYDYTETGEGQFQVTSRVGDQFVGHFEEYLRCCCGLAVVSIYDAGDGVYEVDTVPIND